MKQAIRLEVAVSEFIKSGGEITKLPPVPASTKQFRNHLRKINLRSNENKERWLALRYQAFKRYGRKCALCNATNAELHIDHIKPKAKYPELTFDINNLQVLCKDCNYGKGVDNEDDWR